MSIIKVSFNYMIKETIVYEKLFNKTVRCQICQRRCLIKEDGWGYCRTRVNHGGKLYSTIYGEVSVSCKAPIEIKPVYHYLPGSHAFSLGSLGCNFLCPGCQNWDISFAKINQLSTKTSYSSPEETIHLTQKYQCQGISWTYNEPTLWFEFTLDGAILAKSAGLYTSYVTNGYITQEALDLIGPYLDIFRVDIKAFERKTYQNIANITQWEGILDIVKRARKKWEMHVEVVTNVIPGINDDPGQMKALAQWIKNDLGADTPWHITRFLPHWHREQLPPTPVKTLKIICEMALAEGLNFVYIGNVLGHSGNHTYCSNCKKILIMRNSWEMVDCRIKGNTCPFCGKEIFGKFT